VVEHGVTILGPLNLPSTLPRDASQMYSANITALLRLLMKDSTLTLNVEDEVIRESLVTHDYKVVHPRVVESLNRNGRKTMV
jgi:NAD(P) transhydrogenase subunit alpha